MEYIDTLSACHHRFRFLLEELSDDSGDVLKKNRLVEEFKNEIDVYCFVSASFFLDPKNKKHTDQFEIKDLNGESIKRCIDELNPMDDTTKWNSQIIRLKEEVDNLFFHFENSIMSSTYMTQN